MTLFSAPNYCGEFDNAGAMMSVDETLLCSFQVCFGVGAYSVAHVNWIPQILKPAEKKAKYPYGGNMGRQMTPPRGKKKKDGQKI